MKKTIVIIGAGPGLGQAVAEKFGKENYHVILIARNIQSLENIHKQLKGIGIESDIMTTDVTDQEALIQTIQQIKTLHGAPDVIVYNVGITTPDTPDLTANDLIDHYKADVAAAYTVITAFADADFAEKKGAIILTGGGLALYPADGYLPLSIDKAALRAMAYIFNARLKDKGIFVGTVTICGTINANHYFSATNIADTYWQMNQKRDKCEYSYQFPQLEPAKIYAGHTPHYGIFEENTEVYWGEVYQLMTGK